jgi:hypothetical protein
MNTPKLVLHRVGKQRSQKEIDAILDKLGAVEIHLCPDFTIFTYEYWKRSEKGRDVETKERNV